MPHADISSVKLAAKLCIGKHVYGPRMRNIERQLPKPPGRKTTDPAALDRLYMKPSGYSKHMSVYFLDPGTAAAAGVGGRRLAAWEAALCAAAREAAGHAALWWGTALVHPVRQGVRTRVISFTCMRVVTCMRVISFTCM